MVDFIVNNYEQILSSITLTIGAVTAIAMLIPGEQPEKALKAVAEFIAKFSKK